MTREDPTKTIAKHAASLDPVPLVDLFIKTLTDKNYSGYMAVRNEIVAQLQERKDLRHKLTDIGIVDMSRLIRV